jgi:uncharacterized protein YndB with AHSA1/START domain
MGTFAIERVVGVPTQQVWAVITDWAGHARWIPLTTMRLGQGPTAVGFTFAGLTGVGRLRFADVMRLTVWSPPSDSGPGDFRLVKVGRLLAGWAEVSVQPLQGGRQTRLIWRENIVIRPARLGRLLTPVTDRVNKALFTRVIADMADEAVRASGPPAPGR